MTTKMNPQQLNYIAAKAAHELAYAACRRHDKKIDSAAKKMGIPTPYAILPESHPEMIEGQRLLDIERAALADLYAAAYALFDWAVTGTLAKHGTPAQKHEIYNAVAKIKKMAYVEKPFERLVDISLRLDATEAA